MRFLPVLAVVLVLGMIAATVWTITGSPGSVDEIPPTPLATPSTPAPEPRFVTRLATSTAAEASVLFFTRTVS